ncbi:MAG: phytochelatin synthase family protein [Pseudomonadota bacterium]
MRRRTKGLLFALFVFPFLFAAFAWYTLQPQEQNLALPPALVSIEGDEGQALLSSAGYTADLLALQDAYVSQRLISYCGVASSVAVLNALGREHDQWDFFTAATKDVRSRLQVTFGGMTLGQLDGLLKAHGLQSQAVHGDDLTLVELRSIVRGNLSMSDDFLLVNYQREALGQGRSGHISPVAAYDEASDRVLIMDTASFKYPPTWVPLELLYGALQEVDSASGEPRGILEVRL